MADQKITDLTAHTNLVDADVIPVVDTVVVQTKKTTWVNIKSVLKTYFDTLYSKETFADGEVPTGTINGDNAEFSLTYTPSPAGSLQLFLNGALQTDGGIDYTLATATITFVNAPPTGSGLICFYRY